MKVVSFFSYKGGVGRTTLLANLAAYMALKADRRMRIACIDLDLTAPGLDIAFDIQDRLPPCSLADFLIGRPVVFEDMYVKLNAERAGGGEEGVFMFPLRRGREARTERLKVGVSPLLAIHLDDLIDKIKKELECDLAFLDTRSGYSLEATPVWLASDKVCLVTRCSYQHLAGTKEMSGFFNALNDARSERLLEPIVVINDVPGDLPEDRLQEVERMRRELNAIQLAENRELRWRDRVIVFDTEFRNAQAREQHVAFIRGCQELAERVAGDE